MKQISLYTLKYEESLDKKCKLLKLKIITSFNRSINKVKEQFMYLFKHE